MGRKPGGELPHPTVGAAGRNAVPPSSHLFDGDDVAALREGVTFLPKLESLAEIEVL